MPKHVVIIGAGPAGLTAAYLLTKEGIPVTVIEADPTYVGGIARTVTYKGYCFDIGGHRFFSKSPEIEALWQELLPDDMLERPRSSRILYRQQFYAYPLKAFEALAKLGLVESTLCVLSYVKAFFVRKKPRSFADWVSKHFGHRLYAIFFKTYTEKVWGMSCDEISADWAAQRIKGLSLFSAIMHAFPLKPKKKVIKTLINTFRYPRKGPEMLWQACREKIIAGGGEVLLGSKVTACVFSEGVWQVTYQDHQQISQTMTGTHLISSAPLRELVTEYLQVRDVATVQAAKKLAYRDFIIVVLMLEDQLKLTDNWIYVHEAQVDVARIQNFKSWSPEMVPDENMCCYGLEYFCFAEDSLWQASDSALIAKASAELVALGLANHTAIKDGYVIRQAKAYPVYDNDYQTHVAKIRQSLEAEYETLYLVGRNGMHKYNNQDHAMMTAILTVKNILASTRQYDVWCVNQDAEYLEANTGALIEGLRQVPARLS